MCVGGGGGGVDDKLRPKSAPTVNDLTNVS